MRTFFEFLNYNQGVIAVIGLSLGIPLTLIGDRLINHFRKRYYHNNLKYLLIQELYMNLNFVYQIGQSYQKNLKNQQNFKLGAAHIPYYGPRTEILEKFIGPEVVEALPLREIQGMVEIYSQLKGIEHEFHIWRDLLQNYTFNDMQTYENRSAFLLQYISPVMNNMLKMWVELVIEIGDKFHEPQVNSINKQLKDLTRNKRYVVTYRSSKIDSRIYPKELINGIKLVICWEKDKEIKNKKVFEIKELVYLYGDKARLF